MTVWTAVAAAESSVQLLQRDIASGRVAPAYLFAGAAGRLPVDTALAFGAALVCAEGGCGACSQCLKALHRSHFDVDLIEPAGMQLLVEQIRDAIRAASRRPVEGPRRVIIVDGADRMNPNSQNAFLKMLEEPPASTTIILVASAPEALLETVRSRCREVTFRQPPPGEVAALLEAQGIDKKKAEAAARTGGDLARATTLATDPVARKLRDELVERTVSPLRDPGEALETAEWLASKMKVIRDRVAEEHKAAREAFDTKESKTVSDQRMRREQRRAEQDAIEASIDDIASVLRDLVVLSKNPDAVVLNGDARTLLADRASHLPAGADAKIIGCLGDIERARRRLRNNANVLLTLEDVFLSVHKAL